jgi:16S rRNA (uracil1498-N3)-methyltransferase
MTAHRFFLEPDRWVAPAPELNSDEAHHFLHVLRGRENAEIEVFDGGGQVARARVVAMGRGTVVLGLRDIHRIPPPAIEIVLYQALPKGSRWDWLIEKATEIGASRIVPLITERSEVRPSSRGEMGGGAPDRWRRIALSAAKQCGIARLPEIKAAARPGDWAALFADSDRVVMGVLDPAAPSLRQVLADLRSAPPARLGILIGPEGDLTPAEISAATEAGALPVSFGPNTLRVETAALFALSVVRNEFG